MGPIQNSINQLIYQASILDQRAIKKQKEQESLKAAEVTAKEKLETSQIKNQTYEQKLKNQELKNQIIQQKLQMMQAKATAAANEQIKAKYDQKKVYKERLTNAQKARMDLTAPHKPLPKKEE